MSLWMTAKGEYIYLPQHLESGTVKNESRNQLYKRRQSSAFSLCQTSVFASDVWPSCINSSFVGKPCSRIGPLIWTICCAVACTLQVGVPEVHQHSAVWRGILQDLTSWLWEVKVPVNKLSNCQTAAAACSVTRQHQLRAKSQRGSR